MAYSTVGTPDYIAPEIFSGHGYTQDCDWWSLGTIMFECQVGWPPFCAEDAHDTYRKIVNWRQSLYFPEDVQLGPEAENLIRRYENIEEEFDLLKLIAFIVSFAILRTVWAGEVLMRSRHTSSSVVLTSMDCAGFEHRSSPSFPPTLTQPTFQRMRSTKQTTQLI
jgi:serine/threonine protein kinase